MIVNLIHNIAININNPLIMISTAAIIPSVNELSVLNSEYVIEGPFCGKFDDSYRFSNSFILFSSVSWNSIRYSLSPKFPFILSKSYCLLQIVLN